MDQPCLLPWPSLEGQPALSECSRLFNSLRVFNAEVPSIHASGYGLRCARVWTGSLYRKSLKSLREVDGRDLLRRLGLAGG